MSNHFGDRPATLSDDRVDQSTSTFTPTGDDIVRELVDRSGSPGNQMLVPRQGTDGWHM